MLMAKALQALQSNCLFLYTPLSSLEGNVYGLLHSAHVQWHASPGQTAQHLFSCSFSFRLIQSTYGHVLFFFSLEVSILKMFSLFTLPGRACPMQWHTPPRSS